MRLADNLYTLIHADEEALSYQIRLRRDCIIYQAHFPGEPITPGVCIAQIAKELMERHEGKPFEIEKVKNVRFYSVLSPVESEEAEFNFSHLEETEDASSLSVRVSVTAHGEEKAKLSFTLGALKKGEGA